MSDSDDDLEGVKRDPAVSRDQFVEWRSPRLGRANPEPMDNPVWVWLIRTGINAWLATEAYDGPSAMDAGPGWCFDRYGQSSTELPDGRVVLIAGEHEDGYDPDFLSTTMLLSDIRMAGSTSTVTRGKPFLQRTFTPRPWRATGSSCLEAWAMRINAGRGKPR